MRWLRLSKPPSMVISTELNDRKVIPKKNSSNGGILPIMKWVLTDFY